MITGPEGYDIFSRNNRGVRLHVYREAAEGGDLFQEYNGRQEGDDEEEVDENDIKNVHIVLATRINLDEMELESHFLSAVNLSQLCGKVMTYADKQNKKRYYDKSVCDK